MATTSGTTTFNLDLAQIVEEAYERVGVEMRTGYELRTARRSLNLLFADWANRGLNMWTFDEGTIPLTYATSTYNLPPDTVDLMETYLRKGAGVTQVDRQMERINQSTYASIPNKTRLGPPNLIQVDRLGTPRVIVWPAPDVNGMYTLVYWRVRRIQDAGNGVNLQDIPFRFLPAMIAGLAYYLALKVPGGLARIDMLKAQYDEAWQTASDEDRDKASVRFVPKV